MNRPTAIVKVENSWMGSHCKVKASGRVNFLAVDYKGCRLQACLRGR